MDEEGFLFQGEVFGGDRLVAFFAVAKEGIFSDVPKVFSCRSASVDRGRIRAWKPQG